MTSRLHPPFLAAACAVASAAAFASDPQPTPASVAGQLATIPTSPAFSMNVHRHEGAAAAAPEAHEPVQQGKGAGRETQAKAGKPEHAAEADPLDHLRQRLAEKLGAKTAAGAGAGARYVMRVSSRGEPGESVISARGGVVANGRRAAAHAASPSPEVPAPALPAHWDYGGLGGPQAWSKIKPEYAQCSGGTRQSPIDIRGGIAVDLEPIRFDYRPSGFSVVDNGRTVQVNLEPGNSITVTGRRFDLVQFHFHRPSEERIDGRQFDMVTHLVHKDVDGKLAVVAVLLDRGSAQPLVQTVWNNLPLEKNDEVRAEGRLDLAQLLPADRRYYTYMGSLTTPPCTEGVLWMVMKQPVSISPEQVAIFAHLYPMNARPIQQADGRLIKQSN